MNGLAYLRAHDLSEACAWLVQHPQASALAGGQSLLAAMKLGLSQPSHLIDLQDIAELHDIRHTPQGLWLGAMVTHAQVARSALIKSTHPMLCRLAAGIADPQVREVGTLGGSLANNDPAACWPAAVMAYDACIVTTQRQLRADAFFNGLFATALQAGELIVGVVFPAAVQAHYLKFEQPASRFALTGVAVVRMNAHQVRVAITGLGEGVVRWPEAEQALQQHWHASALQGMQLDPNCAMSDLHASAAYRAHLSAVLCRRAVAAMTGEPDASAGTGHGSHTHHSASAPQPALAPTPRANGLWRAILGFFRR